MVGTVSQLTRLRGFGPLRVRAPSALQNGSDEDQSEEKPAYTRADRARAARSQLDADRGDRGSRGPRGAGEPCFAKDCARKLASPSRRRQVDR